MWQMPSPGLEQTGWIGVFQDIQEDQSAMGPNRGGPICIQSVQLESGAETTDAFIQQ